MRFTDHYRLGAIEQGQPLDPLEDSRRFLTIDRQLLGLFQIFGNGVIEGWTLTPANGLEITVDSGRGHVFYMSAETTTPRIVTGLIPNSINYIYAEPVDQTRFNRDVRFFPSTTMFIGTVNMVLLGSATTNSSNVTSIDMTLRNDISFIQTIRNLINQHRHRGGTSNPSKIDLSSEVMGRLPGYRIEGIDASKVTSGRLQSGRIPTIEHGDLLNSGILTHSQLDSFVRNLSNPNVRLLGELSAVNLLQLYLAYKHQWNEVDAYATNMMSIIPGITPDSFTDFQNTTAIVDRYNHAIIGIPSIGGQLHRTTFSSQYDFENAFINVNLEISKTVDGIDYLKIDRPTTETIIEGFDNVFSDNISVPNWTLETVASNDNTTFTTDSSEKSDGAYSAKLNLDQSFRVQVTRMFSTPEDWANYNEISLDIETLSAYHGQVRFQIFGPLISAGQYQVLDDFILVDASEITTGFKEVTRDISNLSRSIISGVRIYTDTALGWDITQPTYVNIDKIEVKNTLFYLPSGYTRFRIQTPQKSKWASISWDADLNGGKIKARARSSSNFALMDQTTSIPFCSYSEVSGFEPNISNDLCLEVEVLLLTDSTKTSSPYLRSLTITYLTSSTSKGLTIDTTEDFLRATKLENVRVFDPGQVLIDGRIDVGDLIYGDSHSLQQVDGFGTSVLGINGANLPLSPLQAMTSNTGLRIPSLDGVASVEKLPDRTYLVADTFNDRVILFDSNGYVLNMIASNNAKSVSTTTSEDNGIALYPIGASYNRDNTILYISWSTSVTFSSIDLSKITIRGAGISITLSGSLDQIVMPQGQKAGLTTGNVTPILLGTVHSGELETYLTNDNVSDTRLFLDVDPATVESGLNLNNTNYATLTGPRGLPIFIGNVKFIVGLHRPISVFLTSRSTWIIGNAKPLLTNDGADPVTGISKSEITSSIEIDPDTGEILWSDNSVDFSILTLGSVVELNERYVAVSGITEDESPVSDVSSSEETVTQTLGIGTVTSKNVVSETNETTSSQSSKTDLDELGGYRGRVKIIEKSSGRVVYDQLTSDGTYGADVQIDQDDQLTIVEKTFNGMVGRGRIVKMDEDGNVFFQYGLGEYASFNDVRILSTGNMMVSS